MIGSTQIKRAFWHDYRAAGRYMVTLAKVPGVMSFSTIEGDWRLPPGTQGASFTHWSPIGKRIAALIYNISSIHPLLKAEQYSVMPDHVHILLWVREMLPQPLGVYIAMFKAAVNKAVGKKHIFQEGFNDQIVTPQRDLNALFDYIRSNPYRLAIRRAHPDFFYRSNTLTIDGTPCQAYGNIHLLANPFKEQVIVHRTDTYSQFARNKAKWLYTAVNGGVLVSPFISPREKEVRMEAEEYGSRIILVTNQPLGEREKPVGREFDNCAKGALLLIAPLQPLDFSRSACLQMNALAKSISI